MNNLPIKRNLSEETRLSSIVLTKKGNVFELHQGIGDDSKNLYITEHGNPDKIYMMVSSDLWNLVFENF